MPKIGFLINPIAGMGGQVGLKGTDGKETLEEAIRKGAKPVSPERGLRFLKELRSLNDKFDLFAAPGKMGADIAGQLKIGHEVVGQIKETTTSEDTVLVTDIMKQNVDLVVFCGGDGTARAVLEGLGRSIPALGVPSGVKIYSSRFRD